MSLQRCIVSFDDAAGVRHSVEVSAESLFEAAALGLSAFREPGFQGEAPAPGARLEVTVAGPAVSHSITVRRLESWLAASGKTPREQGLKRRLREMLGRS